MTDDFPFLAAVAADGAAPYRLLEHLDALGVSISRNTLYRRVGELVTQGLLRETKAKGERGSRPLTLTRKGHARLRSGSARVLREESLASPLFALAVAAADAADDPETERILRERMSGAARQLTRAERADAAAGDAFWAATERERRVAHLKADLQWLQTVVARRSVEGPVALAG